MKKLPEDISEDFGDEIKGGAVEARFSSKVKRKGLVIPQGLIELKGHSLYL